MKNKPTLDELRARVESKGSSRTSQLSDFLFNSMLIYKLGDMLFPKGLFQPFLGSLTEKDELLSDLLAYAEEAKTELTESRKRWANELEQAITAKQASEKRVEIMRGALEHASHAIPPSVTLQIVEQALADAGGE